MLDVTQTFEKCLLDALSDNYQACFGDEHTDYRDLVQDAAKAAVEHISNCDALYHNMEHTIYVTMTGQAILTGKHQESPITSEQWTSVTLALLFHDIGFVRGICAKDKDGQFYSGTDGDELVTLQRGSSDASLMPYHVCRGQCYAEENYHQHEFIDLELIKECIERTRFPVPDDSRYENTTDFPGLVRAADLIGQFSDPRYLQKLNALFQEFEEQGLNGIIGYSTPQDMRDNYPTFYHDKVEPYIADGVRFLNKTDKGQEIIRSMDSNLQTAKEGATSD
ncbi:MAG: metal-dependent phosphohydrolase [Gammaproteobacteria bacterium]|nr:MAG: metal-dependent phosphohydrolase [Gammaproteobacteria bacterium]